MKASRLVAPARLEVVTAGAGVNEDIAGDSPPFFWVLDGSTPLFRKNVHGSRSDAEWLVRTIDAWLRRALVDPGTRDLRRVIESLATVLGREFKRAGVPTGYEGPSAALGLVRVLSDRIDYAILGDITVVIRTGRQLTVVRDERISKFDKEVVALLTRELSTGATYEHALAVVREALRDNRKYMNEQPGYWILANRARAARHAIVGSVSIRTASDVLVCSDGFSRVVDLFRLYRGWNGLLSELRRGSLETPLGRLREAERKDPHCRRYPRLGPEDDATALYLHTGRLQTGRKTALASGSTRA